MNYLLFAAILLSPLYVWRFSIGGLPTNFLMLFLAGLQLFWLLKILASKEWNEVYQNLVKIDRYIIVGFVGFFASSVIALFIGGLTQPNLGQWLVLFFQPMLFAIMLYHELIADAEVENNSTQKLINYLYIFVGVAGLLAVVQYLTLWTVPEGWWGNAEEPRRAISFFAHPNAFALYITPLLAFLLPSLVAKLEYFKQHWVWFVLWILGAVGLFLSLSRGAWIGLMASLVLFGIITASRKFLFSSIMALVLVSLVVLSVPNLRYRVLLPFMGEKSTVARFSLWETGWKTVKDSPVLGQGINGFSNNWEKFNTDPNLQPYHFPHNIFLNFWADLGLLGLASFLLISLRVIWLAWWRRRQVISVGVILFLVAMALHGLIDIPYFKNDLALLFWVIITLFVSKLTLTDAKNPKII